MVHGGTQITNLRARGMQFLDTPDKYYTNLRERLKSSPITVTEDLDTVASSSFWSLSICTSTLSPPDTVWGRG